MDILRVDSGLNKSYKTDFFDYGSCAYKSCDAIDSDVTRGFLCFRRFLKFARAPTEDRKKQDPIITTEPRLSINVYTTLPAQDE